MLTCPRCADLVSPSLASCPGCGTLLTEGDSGRNHSRRRWHRRGDCVYCGIPCRGMTCSAHKDLLKLDPAYAGEIALRSRA